MQLCQFNILDTSALTFNLIDNTAYTHMDFAGSTSYSFKNSITGTGTQNYNCTITYLAGI